MTSYGLPHHDSKPSSSLRVTPLTVRRHSALLADSWQLTANSLQLTADSFYLLTAFPTTVIDSSLTLRMTPFVLRHYDAFRSPLLVTCFPQIVILNGGKNALWERRETGQWHGVKNLLLGWHLTASAAFIKRRKNCQLTDDRSRLSVCFLS